MKLSIVYIKPTMASTRKVLKNLYLLIWNGYTSSISWARELAEEFEKN